MEFEWDEGPHVVKQYEEEKNHVKGFKIRVKNVSWCSSDELNIEKDKVCRFASELCKLKSH
jgi:hypothetical protein